MKIVWKLLLACVLAIAFCTQAKAQSALPSSLETIEESAFENDGSLEGLWVCPEGVEAVQANAFSGTKLFALDVPESAQFLGIQAFSNAAYVRVRGSETQVNGLSGLRYVIAPAESAAFVWSEANQVDFVAENELLENDGFFYRQTADGWMLMSAVDPAQIKGKVTIPETLNSQRVSAVTDYAFMCCDELTVLRLPNNLEARFPQSAVNDCFQAEISFYPVSKPNYPSVVPGIDFGGAKIWIHDYWTSSSARKENPTEQEQATYDYRDWIMATYNCEIEQIADGDWGSNASRLVNFFGAPDGSLRLYILPPDFVGGPLAQGALAIWNGNSLIDLNDGHWNAAIVDLLTFGGRTYGVSTGNSEPRQCLYFNKRVLEEAGIVWETIYDMQADGIWNWNAFESLLSQIQKDTDNDGIIDVWGMTGSDVDMYRVAVFANGGCFFDSDKNGNLVIAASNDNALEALVWAKDIWNTYGYQQHADGSWDYYKEAWKQGFCGFYMYQTYGGFNEHSEMSDMADDWGCVAFPVGPKGATYTNIVSDSVTVIPNVYDAETVANLAYIYQLWSAATPGYDDEYAWVGNKLNYTDDRAVLETYAMLREPEHCSADKVLYLGSVNDVEGQDFLWSLGGSTPAELLEAKTPVWQGLLDAFNGK